VSPCYSNAFLPGDYCSVAPDGCGTIISFDFCPLLSDSSIAFITLDDRAAIASSSSLTIITLDDSSLASRAYLSRGTFESQPRNQSESNRRRDHSESNLLFLRVHFVSPSTSS
jgi:hypothetical protein